jgi:hypothetical protein
MGKLRSGAGVDDFICPADIILGIAGQWSVAYKNAVVFHHISEWDALGWRVERFSLVGDDLVPYRLKVNFHGTPPFVFALSHWLEAEVNP